MTRSSAVLNMAGFLDRDTKIQSLVQASSKAILQAADEGNPEATDGLKVLKHGDGAEFAYNMYKEYVSDSNFQYFPDFMRKLDKMLYEFRGNQPLELEEEDDEDEDEDGGFSKKRSRRKKGKYKPLKKRPKAVRPIPTPDSSDSEPEPEETAVVSSTFEALDRLYNHKHR